MTLHQTTFDVRQFRPRRSSIGSDVWQTRLRPTGLERTRDNKPGIRWRRNHEHRRDNGNACSDHAATALTAVAQQPRPYGPPMSLEVAKKAMAAAEAEAKNNNWPVAIAILDTTGSLVMLEKLDTAPMGSVDLAIGKARTALDFTSKQSRKTRFRGGKPDDYNPEPGRRPARGRPPVARRSWK
jgi:hypothetical protein